MKHSASLQLNPAIALLYESIMTEVSLNPYKLEYYQHWGGLSLLGGYSAYIGAAVIIDTAPVAVPLLLASALGMITLGMINVHWLDQAEKNCITSVNEAMHNHLADKLTTFSESRLQMIIAKIDKMMNELTSLSNVQIQALTKFTNTYKLTMNKLYLNLQSELFKLTYPEYEISEEKLIPRTFETFRTTLFLSDKTRFDLAAAKVPLQQFDIEHFHCLKQLNHSNIGKYYGILKCVSEEDFYYIIIDKMDGDLSTDGRKHLSEMKENQISDILYQITDALRYIHDRCLIHSNVNPANIFFKNLGDQFLFYLGNFSYLLFDPMIPCGTSKYTAPEFTDRSLGPVTHKSDIYSWGVTIKELVGCVPYNTVSNSEKLNRWLEIVDHCTKSCPADRPSCKKILEACKLSAN
ncbi:unnamed protein product [Adineta ricciae]|uniref:Protein kinase domain-containing protein n=1 Tax=Adineta ricciae TaxID=249248 RepID=A0A815P4F2_ADIRI|nr:unnamed protein product [Adineta ricciae]CAF1589696.1 unnamed protein product [Adineta ricciae]